MGQQLKEALFNAGIVSKEKIIKQEKEKLLKKVHLKDQGMKSDQIRIVCEVCDKSAPDVERYNHKNKKIEGKKWLCIPCADEYCIDDNCRETCQSSHSKSGYFRRQYGRTRKF